MRTGNIHQNIHILEKFSFVLYFFYNNCLRTKEQGKNSAYTKRVIYSPMLLTAYVGVYLSDQLGDSYP